MSIVREVSRECGNQRLATRSYHLMTGVTWFGFLAWLLFAAVPALSAQPAKAREASTKPSAVVELKSEAPVASASAAKVPADPATCVKPGDADASENLSNEKPIASPSASVPASDSEAADESASQSNAEFMKDKLKLSIGGGKGAASDEPLQCGVDEARSQAKENDPAPSK